MAGDGDPTAPAAYTGHYPIAHRAGEIERLLIQGAAMAEGTRDMLARIGVGEGWRCLDLGCGPEGITPLLSAAVGDAGAVVGMDMDEGFLEFARARAPANVSFARGDAYRTGLDGGSFDLVHMRFIACTAGDPERLIAEAMRLARPGGTVALQECDLRSLAAWPPHPAFDSLRDALIGTFGGIGADADIARRLYRLCRGMGLEDVAYRPFVLGVRSTDAMADYLPSTVESVRAKLLELGLAAETGLDGDLAACRAHLAQPDTVFDMYTVVQVWGRNPA